MSFLDLFNDFAESNNNEEPTPGYAFVAYLNGQKQKSLGNYFESILFYDKAIEIDNSFEEAYYNRGIAKAKSGDNKGANEDFSNAISLNPNNENAYYNRGLLKHRTEDYQGAVKDYSEAIEINPANEKAFNNRGIVRSILLEFNGALRDFNKAIEIKKQNVEAYFNRGLVKIKLKDFHGALNDFTEVINIDPTNAAAHTKSGIVKRELGNIPGAVNEFINALEINPDNKEAITYLSIEYSNMKNLENKNISLREVDDIKNDELSEKLLEIKIGNQIWMEKNLNVDHYRNGDPIPEVRDPERWGNLKTGAWCYYDNDMENGEKYGKLYNWYAVNDPRGLAPKGWHIPTKAELETLMTTVGKDGNKLKREDQGTGSGVGINTSGFTALLAGKRYGAIGYFYTLGGEAYYWSSTEDCAPYSFYLYLYYNDSNICLYVEGKDNGFSIRCLKD